VDITQLLRDTAELVSRDPAGADVTVDIVGPSVTLGADAQLLREAFLNLLLNAAQAIAGAGDVRIAVALSGDCCEITLADDGPGIPPAVLDKIFQPFFTTRASGTGLGLSTVKRTIEAHGGEIDVACPEDGGTVVTVRLPLAPRGDAP
jgi:signal transduction histidine kinase